MSSPASSSAVAFYYYMIVPPSFSGEFMAFSRRASSSLNSAAAIACRFI